MNVFQIALLIGLSFTMWRAWNLNNAIPWLLLGAASFVVSTAWQRYGMPSPPIFGAITDFVIWLIVYHNAKQRWELHFTVCFAAMIVMNLVFVFAHASSSLPDISNYWRVTFLEICNWAALAIVWLTADTEHAHAGGTESRITAHSRFNYIVRSLHLQRKEPPFTKVP